MRLWVLALTMAPATIAPRALAQLPRRVPAGFAAITVADLDASVRWYERYLGAHLVSASRAPSGIAESRSVANDYLLVELIHFAAPPAADTAHHNPRVVGLQKTGVWVPRTTFDSTFSHLRVLGATFVGGVFGDSALHARSFIVKDNTGVLVQFFAADTSS